MGCGCGGGRRNVGSRAVTPQIQAANAKTVQTQSNQRQALVQQAKERLLQSGPQAASEAERKRRIQVSLRRRNQGKG